MTLVKVRLVVVAVAITLVTRGMELLILYQKMLAVGVPKFAVKVKTTVLPALVATFNGAMLVMLGLAVTFKLTTPLVAEPEALVRIAK